MPEQEVVKPSYKYLCDLSVKLFKPETIFEEKITPDQWVLFAPDFPGLPVIIDNSVHAVLASFTNGKLTSAVLAETDNFDKTCSAILFLEERGFLRSEPTTLPFKPPLDLKRVPSSFGVWLHIINKCNLACRYCFVEHKGEEVMTDRVMEQTADRIAHTAVLRNIQTFDLKFAGGEPTLDIARMERFYDLLSKKLEGTGTTFWTSVLSNGTVLNKRLLDFFKRPQTGIGISLDGCGKTHDIYRVFKGSGKGSWNIIEQNIRNLAEHSIKPYIMATISQATASGLTQFLNWIFQNDYRTRLSVVRQPSSCKDCNNMSLMDGYEQLCSDMIDAFELALTEMERPSTFINLRTAIEICELHFDRPVDGVSCSIGFSHVVIKPDGTIVPCPMMIDSPGKNPSIDLLDSCRYCFPYRQSERGQMPDQDICLNCKWFPVCAGGCAVTNLRTNGHPFTTSKLCSFYKYIIPRYVVFFGKKLVQAAQRKSLPT